MWIVSFERIFLAASSTTVLASSARPELSTACYHGAKVRKHIFQGPTKIQRIKYQYAHILSHKHTIIPTNCSCCSEILVIWIILQLGDILINGLLRKEATCAFQSFRSCVCSLSPHHEATIDPMIPPVALTTVAATTAAKASETTCPSWRQANISSYPWWRGEMCFEQNMDRWVESK